MLSHPSECVPYSEKQKLSSLRETYGQLQRSYQHLEKDMGRRKEREAELLTLTEKLSSANAELQAERSSWDTKVCHFYTYMTSVLLMLPAGILLFFPPPSSVEQVTSLSEEVSVQRSSLSQTQEARKKAETELAELREDSHSQISQLVESLEQKSKAG